MGRVKHVCHAVGCDVEVPPKRLMCLKHWFMVPKTLQNRVWSAYRRGQERDKNPTREYLAAAHDAIRSVVLVEGRKR